jgi:hypothetical protein
LNRNFETVRVNLEICFAVKRGNSCHSNDYHGQLTS